MRRLRTLALLLPLAACGEAAQRDVRVDANQIERLSRPRPEPVVDPQVSARPQPLTGADLAGAGMPDPPGCDFSSSGRRLFAVTASDAIARIQGELYHFNHSSPVGPTGGFVEDRRLSISVGRTSEIVPGADEAGRWPARLTVTNRRTRAQVELTGTWRCGPT